MSSLSRRTAALFVSVLLVFISASLLVSSGLKHHTREQYPISRRLLSSPSNSTAGGHRQLLLKQFRLRSESLPEVHPSEPYVVFVDNETGESAGTIKFGNDSHPLSWLVDSREPRGVDDEGKEYIFFFVVPIKDGFNGVMKGILSRCYNLRRAEKRKNPESLTFIDGVLNIDVQTFSGLQKARSKNIIDLGLLDVFTTSYFWEGMLLFKPHHRGRAFTVLYHPVRRIESWYKVQGEGEGLQKYLESPIYIDNWLVRSLTNDKKGQLTEEHLLVAKGILARKFFVGIADHLKETIKRLEMYYDWRESTNWMESSVGCVEEYLKNNQGMSEKTTIERGSQEWELIAAKEKYDLMLYYYALELFAKQGSTMFGRPYVDKDGKIVDFAELAQKKKLEEQISEVQVVKVDGSGR